MLDRRERLPTRPCWAGFHVRPTYADAAPASPRATTVTPMTDVLTVVAWIRAAPGAEDAVREALLSIVPPTLAEEGCIEYKLHVVDDDPGLLYFVEQWRSGEDLDIHLGSAHVREAIAAVEDKIEGIDIKRMTRIA